MKTLYQHQQSTQLNVFNKHLVTDKITSLMRSNKTNPLLKTAIRKFC